MAGWRISRASIPRGGRARFIVVRCVFLSCLFLGGILVALSAASCRVLAPENKPLEACRRSCERRAKEVCTPAQCERGCELILDRLIEREGENVVGCVAAGPRRCTDVVWADCASRVGAHADGGPPGPPPPPEED
ncbi:MAG TPA: hypothetical protein VM580_33920 [Labilithrix sp.]|nr:hypothetical protein [Labilithrix sp.]